MRARISTVFLSTIAAVLLLAACGGGTETTAADDQTVTSEPAQQEVAAAPEPAYASFTLEEAIAGDWRDATNRARDVYRHPQETLTFFGLQPDMTVVEIWPGGGWYTEIIGPVLNAKGQYIAAGFEPSETSDYVNNAIQRLNDKLAERPDLYGRAVVTRFGQGNTQLAVDETADLIVTFRNVHNWMRASENGLDERFFVAAFAALKPGGVLGVVEHRANPNGPEDPEAKSGYVPESYVIALAEAAGFVLQASSEINANPKDTKDHPRGVWTLPPSFALGDQDREKYAAIGESDRMTLKFVKPAIALTDRLVLGD